MELQKHRFYRLYSTTDKTSAFWYSTVLVNAICWVRSERNDSIHWRTMSVSPDVMLGSNTAYMMLQNTIGSCNNPVSKMPFIVCRDILESFTQACSFEHFVTQLMFTRMTYCPYNLYALLYLYLATSWHTTLIQKLFVVSLMLGWVSVLKTFFMAPICLCVTILVSVLLYHSGLTLPPEI